MKFFDAHNRLRINDFHLFMGKEEPSKRAFFNYQDRPLGDIASCCSYGIVTSKDSRGRLSRVTIHHGAVEYAAGAGWLYHARQRQQKEDLWSVNAAGDCSSAKPSVT